MKGAKETVTRNYNGVMLRDVRRHRVPGRDRQDSGLRDLRIVLVGRDVR
jgi:hypothetical protein